MDNSMDNENTTDEQSPSISTELSSSKIRPKERSRSQTTPTNTDINDPENLDYEDIDDNHPVKKIPDQGKSSMDFADEEGEVSNNPPEINNGSSSLPKNPGTASDEGEVDEADLEDGEIHDPSTSKHPNFSSDHPSDGNRNRNNIGVPSSPQAKVHCRFFLQGRCHWGSNCKYIHPTNDPTKNSTNLPVDGPLSTNNEISPPTSAGIPLVQPPTNTWISPQATTVPTQFFPNPLLRGGQIPPPNLPLVPPTGTESAWERGLRSAKTLREQSMRRKQQDKDFNDKKFNLTIRDALDDKEIDDNLLNIDRPSSIDYESNDYPDQRVYSDRYHSYGYSGSSGNSHYNNHPRMNHNNNNNNNNNSRHHHNPSLNEPSDRRTRHSDDYTDNRIRKEKSSIKDSKSASKRDDLSSYKRNPSQQQYPSGSHHNNDGQAHLNNYGNRKGDDWHDPWDRSRIHSSSNRRSSGGGRGPSYSSSSASSSSSSRSSRSRSHSTSSSSRSRSRSRSRPKRRSPSVTRATATTKSSSEAMKNGNEKKSNGNKKLVSPSSTTNKFLPGRQISSHTLKKAEKSSSSSTKKSSSSNHAKEPRGKDSDIPTKKPIKKENINRSDSTSSSSSSDSDRKRVTHRSSSSSSDSSDTENETGTKSKANTTGKPATDEQKAASRPLSSSTGSGKKSKNDSIAHGASKTKEPSSTSTSAKKRRDTSSSTGSTSTTKKTKLNDSHKSSTDASNAENSDSSKKKEKQKILKKLQEVEKLINQRSTKTSS